MNESLPLLALTAAALGFIHTVLGPDHYLPFVVMSRSGRWSLLKTTLVTILCGLGHVLSSVVIGLIGIGLGIAVSRLEAVESVRGELAAWALIAFGLVYFIWGMRRAIKIKEPHGHIHIGKHTIPTTSEDAAHASVDGATKPSMTPWVLFIVFVLGPCEPLIPILMYPAAQNNVAGAILVAAIFSLVTIATMLTTVLILRAGVNRIPLTGMERYIHAIAGGTILVCGLSIQFLGL